jgi:spermidine/putrescine transport system substrate-binding protein
MRSIALSLILFGLAGCSIGPTPSTPKPTISQKPTLRMLAWVGYEEPDFIKEVERRTGAKIEVKTYVGGDKMMSLFKAAPNAYDLIVVDAEYGSELFEDGKLIKLPASAWKAPDLFAPFSRGEPAKKAGDVYGVVVRWGAVGLVYNTDHITQKEASSYSILWNAKLKDKVGIFDWYLPNMGVLSKFYLANHPRSPAEQGSSFSLTQSELDGLKSLLIKLRPQVRSFQANTGDVISDLKSGDVWITPGIGEWAAASLKEQSQPIEWIVPKEGGIMWIECLAIPSSSRQHDLAKKVIAAIRDPKVLALLAWRKAYVSQSPSKSSYKYLTKERRDLLHAGNLEEVQSLINNLEVRRLPGPGPYTVERDWIGAWNVFTLGR